MQTTLKPLTRQHVAVLVALAALALAAVVFAHDSRGILSAHYRVDTAAGRQAYLHTLGFEIDPASEDIQRTSVPLRFDSMMADYNALQRRQGFDLTPYAGLPVTVVTYALQDAPDELVTLWVCNGVVIGGDVHTAAADGWMTGIIDD